MSFEGYNYAQGSSVIDSSYCAGYVMNTESNGPQDMLDLFHAKDVPISLTRDNSKLQTSKNWNDYMRKYWVKYRFIKSHHLEQNPFERDMASWKADMTKIMIDYDVDPKGWFKVMQHSAEVQNHRANKSNEYNLPPLTAAKGGIGDITLLTTFCFNYDVLYQEYTPKSPKEGGN